MKLPKFQKKRDGNVSHRSEGFRKRALVVALFMAITGLFFLIVVLHFIGWLEIF